MIWKFPNRCSQIINHKLYKFFLCPPQFHTPAVHHISSTQKGHFFSAPKSLSSTPKPLSSTNNTGIFEAVLTAVLIWGFLCGTEGCVELWGFWFGAEGGFDVELRDLGVEKVWSLCGTYVLNWEGLCGTEGTQKFLN